MNETEIQKLLWRTVMDEMRVFKFQDWLQPKLGLGNTTYTESRIYAPICCPSCFEPIETSYTQCQNCGFILDISMIETLRDNAFELAVYAWNYRKKYEEAIRQNKIYQGRVATHYHLVPPEGWLIYLASVALAAILGGLSYDGFKKLISLVRDNFRKRFQKEIPRGKWQRQFYSNLREYFFGKRNPNSPICRAYIEGIIKGSMLIAEAESSPDFEIRLAESLKSIENLVESEELRVPGISSNNKSKPKLDEKKIIKELRKSIYEQELKINQLKHYLQETNTLIEGDKEQT